MNNRIARLRHLLAAQKVGALLILNATNIRYLTGFKASDAWLLVTGRKAFYITDFRYIEEVKKALPKDVQVVCFKDSLYKTVIDLAKAQKAKALGFDEKHLTVAQFNRLKTLAGSTLALKPANDLVEVLRVRKDKAELKTMRQAIKINHEAYRFIKPFIRPGVTERQLLHKLEGFIQKKGVAFSFPPIIASGPNAAFPHARVSERKLRAGEPLLLDMGIEVNGYKSDLTRMFFLGRMTPSFEKVLCLIRRAQQEAYKVIKSGVAAKDIDAVARGFLEKHDLAKYFGHSLGHGVGLDIHEDPRLSSKSGVIVEEGMVITVEPGVYFPKKYGVRLEEMVLVTKTGCEVLSDYDQ